MSLQLRVYLCMIVTYELLTDTEYFCESQGAHLASVHSKVSWPWHCTSMPSVGVRLQLAVGWYLQGSTSNRIPS